MDPQQNHGDKSEQTSSELGEVSDLRQIFAQEFREQESLRMTAGFFPLNYRKVDLKDVDCAKLAELLNLSTPTSSGVYAMLPMGKAVYSRLEKLLDAKLSQIGGQKISLPVLQPLEVWRPGESDGRYDTFKDTFFHTSLDARSLCLSPSCEEFIVETIRPLGSISHKHLPFVLYQQEPHFRINRGAHGLHRSSEYVLHESYVFENGEEQCSNWQEKLANAYCDALKVCGVSPVSGPECREGHEPSAHSSINIYVPQATVTEDTSHIFGEEAILVGPDGKLLATTLPIEVLSDSSSSQYGDRGKLLRVSRVAQSSMLGTHYAELGDGLYYTNDKGQREPLRIVSGGFSLAKGLVALLEHHRTPDGVSWPIAVAPYEIALVPVGSGGSDTYVMAEKAFSELQAKGFRVLLDDRKVSAGVKFNDQDRIGCPIRVVIGPRSLKNGEFEIQAKSVSKPVLFPLHQISEAVSRVYALELNEELGSYQ